MFYTYVRQLPMVEDNLDLVKGDRLVYECGTIRKAKADDRGFRAIVLEDKIRGVTYRVGQHGMVVESSAGPTFIRNPGELKHTPFAMNGDAAEVNAFLLLCKKLVAEHKRKNSLYARLRRFSKEPVGILLIAGAIIYAVVTIIVLYFG